MGRLCQRQCGRCRVFEDHVRFARQRTGGMAIVNLRIGFERCAGDDIAPITGIKRVARAEKNTAADQVKLSSAQIERLNNLTPASGERHNEGNMAAVER
jgi:aryl-alcohol dehydrogenase-like predicted oxidoreductase